MEVRIRAGSLRTRARRNTLAHAASVHIGKAGDSMPIMSLQAAIEQSIRTAPGTYGSEAFVTMSMHDAEAPFCMGSRGRYSLPIFPLAGSPRP